MPTPTESRLTASVTASFSLGPSQLSQATAGHRIVAVAGALGELLSFSIGAALAC